MAEPEVVERLSKHQRQALDRLFRRYAESQVAFQQASQNLNDAIFALREPEKGVSFSLDEMAWVRNGKPEEEDDGEAG